MELSIDPITEFFNKHGIYFTDYQNHITEMVLNLNKTIDDIVDLSGNDLDKSDLTESIHFYSNFFELKVFDILNDPENVFEDSDLLNVISNFDNYSNMLKSRAYGMLDESYFLSEINGSLNLALGLKYFYLFTGDLHLFGDEKDQSSKFASQLKTKMIKNSNEARKYFNEAISYFSKSESNFMQIHENFDEKKAILFENRLSDNIANALINLYTIEDNLNDVDLISKNELSMYSKPHQKTLNKLMTRMKLNMNNKYFESEDSIYNFTRSYLTLSEYVPKIDMNDYNFYATMVGLYGGVSGVDLRDKAIRNYKSDPLIFNDTILNKTLWEFVDKNSENAAIAMKDYYLNPKPKKDLDEHLAKYSYANKNEDVSQNPESFTDISKTIHH